jgi:hypothetical protein
MQLELSTDERDLLARLIEREIGETRVEARRTATREFHDRLQRDEASLRALLERLQAAAA